MEETFEETKRECGGEKENENIDFTNEELEKNGTGESNELESDESNHNNNDGNDASTIKLSKNQLKKIKKSKRWEEKKQFQKEQKKLLKLNKRKLEEISTSVVNTEEDGSKENGHKEDDEGEQERKRNQISLERKLLKQQKKDKFIQECNINYKVVIDCSWENDHTDSTLKSLTQQIMYCYGLNRQYEHPSRLFITGVGTKTRSLLAKNNSQHWIGTSIHSEDFLTVLTNYYQNEYSQSHSSSSSSSSPPPMNISDKIVYLTSDSENVLESLDHSTTYVIGGIVDRNRLKGITNKKAQELNLQTAKLPIKEYMKMSATHVLTVNHVFDILKQYQESNSWKIALERVVPMRKGAQSTLSDQDILNGNEEDRENENEEEDREENGKDERNEMELNIEIENSTSSHERKSN